MDANSVARNDVPNDRRGQAQPNPDAEPVDQAGYEVETVDPVARETYECPICLGILRDPHLNNCCGHHFCKACIHKVAWGPGDCPICKEQGFRVFPNLDMKRKVNQLRVKCVNYDHGCPWTGELKQLMEAHRRGCEFAEKPCQYGCGRGLRRRELEDHWRECPNLPVKELTKKVSEENMELRNLLLEAKRDHEKTLKEMASLKAQVEQLQTLAKSVKSLEEDQDHQREKMDSWVKKQEMLSSKQEKTDQVLEKYRGKLQVIQEQIHKDAGTHEQEVDKFHRLLGSAMDDSSKLRSVITRFLDSSRHLPPLQLVMTDFSTHRAKHDWWHSDPFYSHLCGYKMHLEVKANGNGNGRGTHVSVYVHLMKGENDDDLQWPLCADVYFKVLNQHSLSEHDVSRKVSFFPGNSAANRVLDGKLAGTGRGYANLLAHTALVTDHNKAYLKDDCLVFQISQVVLVQSVSSRSQTASV